ncbi:citrate/tricarballylate utilization protein [Trinickia symbiotica]|uniref:Tricarballylate utilization protein TcuB n=1 Tax=Trinickia symbiotica TaxID=863227 RepID=A0A2N7X5V2_9BURK|nr:tricarballylate utilization 4Fe-4S protein TcuB [Trinickia symbiotica]PMS37136.1 tricarballylate utilization protein TcuB [Trinickia symbiotica]PPK42913.1 citrate/tricarballylate utilization protein [Trinickia symbiotica]
MQQLDTLIESARTWSDRATHSAHDADANAEAEVARIMQICNACRYCEGFCAVFPAMTRRLEFGTADVHYLANLCHNCGACLHACQYAPPHEFAVNVPNAMARVRMNTYRHYAWPRALGALYERNGLALSLALAGGLALFLILPLALRGTLWMSAPGGNFYEVFSHSLMVAFFAPPFVYALVALALGVRRFWRETSAGHASGPAVLEAGGAVATLKYLDGGHGEGCNNEDDAFTLSRRRFHQLTFYGFLLCFLSTCIATLYHYLLRLEAPYAYTSVPTLVGTIGGIALVIGVVGLWRLNVRRHPLAGDPQQKPMDRGFMALLLLIAASGLALEVWRATPSMPILLAVHLGAVLSFFLTLPYGKFAHGPLRAAALLKWAIERREPNRTGLTED